MGIFSDIKKGLKGSKEYQKGKAKRKAKRAKSPLGKAVKQVVKDVKSAVKGSKEYQAGKAKKKAGKSWTKAVKAQKKAGGPNLSTLVKARGMHKKGTSEYAKIQNQINKAYGSTVRHKATKVAPKVKAKVKAKAPKVAEKGKAYSSEEFSKLPAEEQAKFKTPAKKNIKTPPKKKESKFSKIEPYPPREDQGPKFNKQKMEEGGKVESNPYGWPSRDARNGGQK